MTEVDLLYGGTFQIDESDIKNAYYDTKFKGIVIETNKGTKVTIKDSNTNRKKWIPTLNLN
jgi:hypothetical protein